MQFALIASEKYDEAKEFNEAENNTDKSKPKAWAHRCISFKRLLNVDCTAKNNQQECAVEESQNCIEKYLI